MVHMGTLMAIFVYFKKDLKGMIMVFWRALKGKFDKNDEYAKLILYILVGTLPAVIVGFTLGDWIDTTFRSVATVTFLIIAVGIVFIIGEMVYKKAKPSNGLNLRKAIVIGIAQSFALIPGVSRSGSTIVAGLFQGVEREAAARFSFLLAIPAVVGAGLLTALKSGGDLTASVSALNLFIGFLSSFVFGLLSVAFLMKFLKNHSLNIFAGYRILLGIVIYAFWIY